MKTTTLKKLVEKQLNRKDLGINEIKSEIMELFELFESEQVLENRGRPRIDKETQKILPTTTEI